MEKKLTDKIHPLKKILSVKNLFIAVLILMLFYQTYKIYSISSTFDSIKDKSEGLIDEFGEVKELTNMFGADLNEMRRNILMPPKDYSIKSVSFSEDAEGEELSEGSSASDGLLSFIDLLTFNKKLAYRKDQFYTINKDFPELLVYCQENGLKPDKEIVENQYGYFFDIKDPEDKVMFSLILNKTSANFIIKNSYDRVESQKDFDEFKNELLNYLKNDFPKSKEKINTLFGSLKNLQNDLGSNELKAVLEAKNLTIDFNKKEDNTKLYFDIKINSGGNIGLIGVYKDNLDYFFTDNINETKLPNSEIILDKFVEFLNNLDTRTFAQKKLEENKRAVEDLSLSEEFLQKLKDAGLAFEKIPREDDKSYFYDIKDGDGNTYTSIVLEKSSGGIKVIDNGNPINLESFLGLKKKP